MVEKIDFKDNKKEISQIKEIRFQNFNNKKKSFNWKFFLFFFIGFLILNSIISSLQYSITDKIAVIDVNGEIIIGSNSNFGSNNKVSSKYLVSVLDEIKLENTYKSVILNINSPGGSPVASDEIANSIREIKNNNISVYCYLNDVAMSGAVWIFVNCDKVYANKNSIIGSIGVTSASLGFENFLKNYNITYRKQTSGKYKDIGTPYRKQTIEENKMIKNLLEEIHNNFISEISKNRNISKNEVKKFSNGEIFTSKKAKELNLIDEIGNFNDIVKIINKKYESSIYITFSQEESLFSSLFDIINKNFNIESNSKVLLK